METEPEAMCPQPKRCPEWLATPGGKRERGPELELSAGSAREYISMFSAIPVCVTLLQQLPRKLIGIQEPSSKESAGLLWPVFCISPPSPGTPRYSSKQVTH